MNESYTGMIKRTLQEQIEKRLFNGRAILLTGPRRSGKTTLIRILNGLILLMLPDDIGISLIQ